ncbi:hypothetical protein [Streptomyces griseiscabiei]|uniref:Uncharacterized protein n=1 Tax=Streptomyces griseiscabiei TaxID=2993540 RepID=A0ABU4L2I2_9ACTN|nr:hypothetical protein [Streptomyces griseiscabiei]MBZ3901493.1 hypothetical protein [Streptomyces griseiscabiei]MDX2909957.1 hypothetical protein [Streptomyces griseiscabiei]
MRAGRCRLSSWRRSLSPRSWPLPLVLERFHEALPKVEIRTRRIDTHGRAGL